MGNVPKEINHTASVHVINKMSKALSCLKGCTNCELIKVKESISNQCMAEGRIEGIDEEARDNRANKTQTVLRELDMLQNQMEKGHLTQAYQETIPVIKVCAACCGAIHGEK